MFGLYLLLNGTERLLVECMRVNKPYNIFGIQSTQAQFIAMMLMVGGAALMIISTLKSNKANTIKIEP